MPTLTQSLDQERAAFVWDKVSSVKGTGKDQEDSYKTAVQKCPARVMTNGLGQTLAYIKGSDRGDELLFRHLNEWLCRPQGTLVWVQLKDGKPCNTQADVTQRITQVSSVTYRHATQEALAVLNWFKRY